MISEANIRTQLERWLAFTQEDLPVLPLARDCARNVCHVLTWVLESKERPFDQYMESTLKNLEFEKNGGRR